jgi:S-(hydroxymethyl)glutathione dehydrogenase/alcohol dehydrogenase
MKAAIFHGPNQPLKIEDVDIDKPRAHEVLIRTVASGVCHSDLHFVDGLYAYPAPAVLGHEAAGIVEDVGPEVSYVKKGDHVICCLSVFCGACNYCMSGRPNLCQNKAATQRAHTDKPRLSQKGQPVLQFADLSSYAERMLVHENATVKIADDVPLAQAALIGCGVTTGMGAVLNTAKIGGARMVIAVDKFEGKLATARRLGATHTVDASSSDPVAAIRDLTGGGVDYSFEAIGLKTVGEQAFACLAPDGVATIIGMIPVGQKLEIEGWELMWGQKKLQGTNMGSNRFRIDMPRYLDFYKQGRLNLDDMISRRLRLDEVNEAFRLMKAGEVARSVLEFN